MIRKISTISLFVTEYDKAKDFYTEKIGFELHVDAPFGEGQRWIAVAPKGAETELILYKLDEGTKHFEAILGKSQALTFEVDDIQATYKELTERGVEFEGPPYDTPWGYFATFIDPDGNRLLLVQNK